MLMHLLLPAVRSAWHVCLFCQPSRLHGGGTNVSCSAFCCFMTLHLVKPLTDLRLSRGKQTPPILPLGWSVAGVAPQSHQWWARRVGGCLRFGESTDDLKHGPVLRVSRMPNVSLVPWQLWFIVLALMWCKPSFKCPKHPRFQCFTYRSMTSLQPPPRSPFHPIPLNYTPNVCNMENHGRWLDFNLSSSSGWGRGRAGQHQHVFGRFKLFLMSAGFTSSAK